MPIWYPFGAAVNKDELSHAYMAPELLALCEFYDFDLFITSCTKYNLFVVTLICRGYMAPEYALWGYLTYKADVNSFGMVTLEILSGNNNSSYRPKNDGVCLLDMVT